MISGTRMAASHRDAGLDGRRAAHTISGIKTRQNEQALTLDGI